MTGALASVCRTPARVAVALALLLATAPPALLAQSTAHSFYQRLLADGSRAFLGGDHQEAVRQLRLAAFGLLEEPPSLVVALVQLALAQVALGDEPGATESISRVLQAETRFGAYADAADAGLGLETSREFEELLVRRYTEPQLRDLGSLARLADVRLERDLAMLGPAERRVRLEELAAAQPEPRWSAQLAQMALDASQLEAAIAYATLVLDAQPADVGARCVRGVARAESGQCEGAVEDLAACPGALEVERQAIARIDCLARLGRLDEASAGLAALPSALLAQRSMRRLERSVSDQVAAALRQAQADQRRQAQLDAAAAREAERLARRGPPAEDAGEPELEGDPPPAETAADPPRSTTSTEATRTPATAAEATSSPDQPATSASASLEPGDAQPAEGRRGRPIVVEEGVPASEQASVAEIRRLAAGARSVDDFVEPLRLARELADRYPGSRDAQHLAAEVAYRASRWSEAVELFGRGGPPAAERPELSFYEAVARYETGDLAGARAALERALPRIQRTPFVERYVSRIRGATSGSGG